MFLLWLKLLLHSTFPPYSADPTTTCTSTAFTNNNHNTNKYEDKNVMSLLFCDIKECHKQSETSDRDQVGTDTLSTLRSNNILCTRDALWTTGRPQPPNMKSLLSGVRVPRPKRNKGVSVSAAGRPSRPDISGLCVCVFSIL